MARKANAPSPAAATEPAGAAVPALAAVPASASDAQDLADQFLKRGPHREYRDFRDLAARHVFLRNTFQFIDDAGSGYGGFNDGLYLDPHSKEGVTMQALSLGNLDLVPSPKFQMRRRLSHYHNFVREIRDKFWSYIIQDKDQIHRKLDDSVKTTPEAGGPAQYKAPWAPELEDFWGDVDQTGTDMTDFLEAPWRDARNFSVGYVCVDRENAAIRHRGDDLRPENRPYAYHVPTQHMVGWRLDKRGRMIAAVIAEPDDDAEDYEDLKPPLRVWTPDLWATFEPLAGVGSNQHTKKIVGYRLDKWGGNPIGEVPIVRLYDNRPGKRRNFGVSEMYTISRIAKTVYNLYSELREIERNCGFPFLAMPMKDPSKVIEIELGTENILAYAAESGHPPAFIEANLNAAKHLVERIHQEVEEAYSESSLRALTGYIRTSSGFHQQAEFDETNRRIGKAAASLEDAEQKIARLFLRWRNVKDAEMKGKFSIEYPREFGIRDRAAAMTEAATFTTLNLGKTANTQELENFFLSRFPRVGRDRIATMVKEATAQLEQASQQNQLNQQSTAQRVRRVIGTQTIPSAA